MFTGIIADIGKVKLRTGNTLAVSAPKTVPELKAGDSISVNGVCVTVTGKDADVFEVDLLSETLNRTNLGKVKAGEALNLELALKAGDRMGGHMVAGHVDGVGRLMRAYRKGNDRVMEVAAPYNIAGYLVPKGSIAVDGVSLTIVKVTGNRFTVHLIPYTLKYTTLGNKKAGSLLNIEADMLARYER